MADLAIWMAGHVSVPIYPSLNCRTARYILEHSESKGCFLGATDEKDMATCGLPPGVHCIALPTAQAPGQRSGTRSSLPPRPFPASP